MLTALIIAVIVITSMAGTALALRKTARLGMPSKEVLERARRRSREIEARERADGRD